MYKDARSQARNNNPAKHETHRHSIIFVHTSSDPMLPIPVDLSYDTRDPFAVKASFFGGTAGEIEWLFSRELLAQGLLAPAGPADVRIKPSDEDFTSVQIHLQTQDGSAVFAVSSEDLSDFLDCTYGIVPLDAESLWADFEAELSRLFSD